MMNIATKNNQSKKHHHLDVETRAAVIRKVRENSVFFGGRRELQWGVPDLIANEFNVRRPYVYTALETLRRMDREEAARARAEEEKRKAEEEISAAMREAASAPTQQELIDQFNGKPIQPDMRDVKTLDANVLMALARLGPIEDRLGDVELHLKLVLDRLDRLANRLPAKWR